ncbi:hypothetical protein TRFO_25339 [Tritrichomonas foetus]|uniref:Uncharacterized protein n=1 Tax=Tritrichomonas foetus TaxID=1144522 RepID=A0A1J4K570_9EUKA|nr:hypothetical protein TRFO_25339 [Tritrichomonas foetus]|eukprot:OHT06593.1 hypothetical protein TRFO_25339 [Tritrichomonas foetus]
MNLKETVIKGRFISVHLPTYNACPSDFLNFSLYDDGKVSSKLPKPYITIDESFGNQPLPPIPDPATYDKLASALEIALDNISLISPLSISRRPSHQFGSFTKLKRHEIATKSAKSLSENDPIILDLKQKLEKLPSIFPSELGQ